MPFCKSSKVCALKQPLRDAVNGSRFSPDAMKELIVLLESVNKHLEQFSKPAPRRRKKKVVEKEYDLP